MAREKSLNAALAHEQKLAAMSAGLDTGPLDDLLTTLLTFTTSEDLASKIHELYERLDMDETGSIDLEELNLGLRRLHLNLRLTEVRIRL